MEEIDINFSHEQANMIKHVGRSTETAIKPEVTGFLKKFVWFMIEGVYWKRLISIPAVNKLT